MVVPVEEARVEVREEPSPESLEPIVRAELSPVVAEVVRRIVVALAREELGRLAASLNRRPRPTAEMVLNGPREPQEPPRALAESSPSPARDGDLAAL